MKISQIFGLCIFSLITSITHAADNRSGDKTTVESKGLVTGKTLYAPYFYAWGWGNTIYPFTSLDDLNQQTGLKAVTLAFLVSITNDAAKSCKITTNQNSSVINPANAIYDNLADINAFRAAGGHVRASFGGANGPYLETRCNSAQQMFESLDAFVTRTGIRDLDFDIEAQDGSGYADPASTLRSQAIKLLQNKYPDLTVSFTLAIMGHDYKWDGPAQLEERKGLKVLQDAVAAGVRIDAVNPMLMEYGPYFWDGMTEKGKTPGDMAVDTLTDMHAQLKAKNIFPGMSDAHIWQRVGATPMIGRNGNGQVANQVFDLASAPQLINFAKANKLALVSHWAINRDQPCIGGATIEACNATGNAKYAFNEKFMALQGTDPGDDKPVAKLDLGGHASVLEPTTRLIKFSATDPKGLKRLVLIKDGVTVKDVAVSGTEHHETYQVSFDASNNGTHRFETYAENDAALESEHIRASIMVQIPTKKHWSLQNPH